MKKKLILSVVLVVLLGLAVVYKFGGITFSRYVSTGSGTTPIVVAIPVTTDSIEIVNVPLFDMKPGETKEYLFNVTNKSGNQITETTMEYYIEIIRTNNLPFTISIEKDSVNTNILTNLVSQTYILPHSVYTVHNYKLIANWDISDNDYRYNNLVDTVDIKIRSVQKTS